MYKHNLVYQNTSLSKARRAKAKGQKPLIIWFTGFSGAGKSTLANALEEELTARGHHTYLLDGDNIRLGLNKNLGFSKEDREENIRRIGEVAKLMVDAGLIVISAFISPFQRDRQLVRDMVEKYEFLEIFVSTPLMVCEKRDTKGLYKKARSGEIKNFTGISSPYEIPINPELTIDTTHDSITESIQIILDHLQLRSIKL